MRHLHLRRPDGVAPEVMNGTVSDLLGRGVTLSQKGRNTHLYTLSEELLPEEFKRVRRELQTLGILDQK